MQNDYFGALWGIFRNRLNDQHPDSDYWLDNAEFSDEQRAEFVAFVAHTIGYNLHREFGKAADGEFSDAWEAYSRQVRLAE